ncbi:MAG TPA: flagellar basal body rod C-terminal domain-containing protein [Bryobacteraceae bacterium]|nr:flagellar basal body rod C-terminal domain-containing protein [Bryobacteraceae bacterium]
MVGFDAPLEGVARAEQSFDQAAGKIAQPLSIDPQNQQDMVSLSEEMVALMEARNSYEANLRSLSTVDQMQKKLIDILG